MQLLKNIKSHPGFAAEPLLFSMVLALYWASNSALYSFVVMYLMSLGYSSAVCGLATGSLSIFSLVVQPLMGYLSDTYISGKKLLLFFFAIAAPATFLIPLAAGYGGLVFFAFVGQSVLDNYQYCLIDSWLIQRVRATSNMDFGRIKAFGALGYSISSLLIGSLIDSLGFWVMFASHSLLLILASLCLYRIEEVSCQNKATSEGEKSLSLSQVLGMLINNRPYLTFILSVVFYQFAIRPCISYFSMIIASLGGSSGQVGTGLFVGSFAEVFVMFAASRFLRRGMRIELIYGIGLLCGVLRLIIFSFPLGIPVMIAGQLLSSVAMGVYSRVFAQYVSEITPAKISGSATTIAIAVTFFFGGVVGNLSGGYLMDSFGTFGYIRICAVSMMLAFVVFLPILLPALRARSCKS